MKKQKKLRFQLKKYRTIEVKYQDLEKQEEKEKLDC